MRSVTSGDPVDSGNAPRNVVLVSIDSLRADHCGFLGDERGLTPTMDEFAAEGVSFDTAIAPGPQTFSSMPAVFTGMQRVPGTVEAYPGSRHWQRRLAAISDHLRRHGSIAERFSEMGYETAGITPNPWTSCASGFDQGFDHFVERNGEADDGWLRALVERVPGIDDDRKTVELALDMLTGRSFFAGWEGMYDEILAVRRQLSEPYFLWVFLLDTHFPFLPSRTYRREQSRVGMYTSALRTEKAMRGRNDELSSGARESMLRSYRDTVRAADGFLERLRSDLAQDDPAYIIHSDHGESFGDHGNYGHDHRKVYEENIHVPYVVYDGQRTGSVTDPVSLATIPSVALSIARDGTFDPASETHTPAIATSECGTKQAVRYPRFKYVEHDEERLLFDLEDDPKETTNIAREYPERCADARTRLGRFERHLVETTDISRAAGTVIESRELDPAVTARSTE